MEDKQVALVEDNSGLPKDVRILDELISKCSKTEQLDKMAESAKLGDLLKMIEIRRKLAPGEANQKQFWTMLETIRQEKLLEIQHPSLVSLKPVEQAEPLSAKDGGNSD